MCRQKSGRMVSLPKHHFFSDIFLSYLKINWRRPNQFQEIIYTLYILVLSRNNKPVKINSYNKSISQLEKRTFYKLFTVVLFVNSFVYVIVLYRVLANTISAYLNLQCFMSSALIKSPYMHIMFEFSKLMNFEYLWIFKIRGITRCL